MKTSIILIVVSICNLSLVSMVYAQDSTKPTYTLKPGVVIMENDKPALGLDLGFQYKSEKTITSESSYPRILSLDIDADGTYLVNPDFNPNTQKAAFFLGYLISFKKAGGITLGQVSESTKDYGSLGLGVDITYEANQRFTEQNFEGGAELRYQNTSNEYVPVLHLAYKFVKPIESDIREALNEDNELFQRFNVNISWNIPLFEQKRVFLAPEMNYFYSMNLDPAIESTGLNEGLYGSVLLGYSFESMDKPVLKYLKHLFIQYRYGQLPVYTNDRETIEGGLTFSF